MWRTFIIRPFWEGSRQRHLYLHFYAPSLKQAFREARVQWPTADGWESL
jgi:hypothetical protein